MKMPIERALTALGLALLSSVVAAQSLQFKPSVHAKVQYDDNVFRASDQPAANEPPRVGDTLTTLGAGAKLTLKESLQALEVRGEYDRITYAKLNDLDYNRYLLAAQARLAAGSAVKLKLDAERERRQENFAYRDDTESGFITIDQASAELRLAVTPRWTGIARAAHYQTENSRLVARDSDLSEQAAEIGAEYRRNGYSFLGFGVRAAEGEYRNRVVMAGDGREKDYDQRSIVVRAGYTPSGLSDLTAQTGYTQRTHDDAAVTDFKGITGRASYIRQFSGLSRLTIDAYRDLFYVEDINANYVENLGLRASFDYRWSAKLAFVTAGEAYNSSYKGSSAFTTIGGQTRKDDVVSLRIGADYQPFYRFSILPEYRYEKRDSNVANSRYDASVIGVDFIYAYGAPTR